MCLLPASAAPLHHAGCHPARVPASPQPADYRCCVGRHPSALLAGIFSPRPVLQIVATQTINISVAASSGYVTLESSSNRGGPPGVLNLRI
jgi:hypothetical protein